MTDEELELLYDSRRHVQKAAKKLSRFKELQDGPMKPLYLNAITDLLEVNHYIAHLTGTENEEA